MNHRNNIPQISESMINVNFFYLFNHQPFCLTVLPMALWNIFAIASTIALCFVCELIQQEKQKLIQLLSRKSGCKCDALIKFHQTDLNLSILNLFNIDMLLLRNVSCEGKYYETFLKLFFSFKMLSTIVVFVIILLQFNLTIRN